MSHGLRDLTVGAEQAAGALVLASMPAAGVLALDFGDQANDTDVSYTGLPFAVRVVDYYAVKTDAGGNAGNSVRLNTAAGGATPVGSACVLNADNSITRSTSMDDSRHEFAAGASLVLRFVKAGGVNNGIVYVKYIRIA